MKIGINLLYLRPGMVGGTETYAHGLLQGLASLEDGDEFVVFVNRESAYWEIPDCARFSRAVCPVSGSTRERRYLFEQFRLPALLKQNRIAVVHSLGYVAPLAPGCRSVVTIPDVSFLAFKYESIRRQLSLAFFVRLSAVRADHVITISEFSRNEIVKALKLAPAKVTAIHLAARTEPIGPADETSLVSALARLRITRPYVLAFSSDYPNKNIPNLLRSFALMKRNSGSPHKMVLVGHRPAGAETAALVRDVGMTEHIVFTGYIDHTSRDVLLANAQFLVFPSFYEGFGLPVLEAMAAKVPVACSNRAALPEVAGAAVVYFDPFSVEDMANKITMVASDYALRTRLQRAGLENLKRFSWEATARKTLDIYRSVLSKAAAKNVPVSP